MTPVAFNAIVTSDIAKWRQIVKDLNIKAE